MIGSSGIFINEDLILEDQAKSRWKIQKIKEVGKEEKWALNRNLGHVRSSLGIVIAFHDVKVLC
jgi:hypothetical protein